MKKGLTSSLSPIMMNLMHIRNGKKAYVVYASGLFVFCSVCLVMKNFNDKIAVMSESVQSYQQMIDKQSDQMRSITREKDRFKRELAEEREDKEVTVTELKNSLQTQEDTHKLTNRKHQKEMADVQERYRELELQKSKLEAKYKTLSKANGDAVADIEHFKAENKNIRSQLHEASTSKTSEMLQLRDSMARISGRAQPLLSPPLCPSREGQIQGPVLSALPPAPAVDRLRPAPTEREGPVAGKSPLNSCCALELVTTIGRAGKDRREQKSREDFTAVQNGLFV